MQPKIFLKLIWLLNVCLGFTLFVVLFLSFYPKNEIKNIPTLLTENASAQDDPVLPPKDVATVSKQKQLGIEMPMRLKIAKIDVDAGIIPVGLTSDGAMDVPKDPAEVAWFNLGARPGEPGTAVIAGHYDWVDNIPAVFNHLHELHKGDKIFVEDEQGVINTFIVRETRTYDADEIAFDVFESEDGKAHLNLITCTGVWDKVSQSYSKRLVVFTDKE